METARDLAGALVQVCAGYLNTKAATAENPDTYQVIIHAGVQAISGDLATEDVPAETPEGAAGTLPVSHPAHPMRCQIQDGLALSLSTLALISCNATISTMIHDTAGAILDVGRRTRKPRAPPGHPRTRPLPLPVPRLPLPPHRRPCQPARKLPAGPGDITATHDAVITPATIVPPNSGSRLDLNLAIWITFANARVKTERREREQASPAA
jgi:hypothetical protein